MRTNYGGPHYCPGIPPLQLIFGGTMQFVSLAGHELPFPEFRRAGGPYGTGQYPMPQETDDRSFWLEVTGSPTALTVRYCDDRHIDNRNLPPTSGVGSLIAGDINCQIGVGDHLVTIAGTVTGLALTATVTVTHGASTEVHQITAVGPGLGPTLVPGAYLADVPNGGSDANDGLSLAFPRLTLPAPTAGGVYYLVRGSIFVQAFSAPTLAYTVASVGSGHWPAINCADVEGGWTDDGLGGYYHDYSLSCPVGASGDVIAIESGRQLQVTGTLAACQATPGSCYADANIGAAPTAVRLTIRPITGDPSTNGLIYEVPRREAAIIAAGGSTVHHVHARGALGHNGEIYIRDTGSATADNLTSVAHAYLTHGNYHNLLLPAGIVRNVVTLFCSPCRQGTNVSGLSSFVWYSSIDASGHTLLMQGAAFIGDSGRNPTGGSFGFQEGYLVVHAGAGTAGALQLDEPLYMYGSGNFLFEGSPCGPKLVNDALIARIAPTGNATYYATNVTENRTRFYGHENAVGATVTTYWGNSPWLAAASINYVGTDNLFVTGFGSAGSTYNGFLYPVGGPTAPEASTNRLLHSTLVNVNDTSTYREPILLHRSLSNNVTPSFTNTQLDANLLTGTWKHSISYIDNAGGAGLTTIIPGDNQVFTLVQCVNYDGTPRSLADWRGWNPPTDINTVQNTATFNAEADPSRPIYVEAASSPTYALHAGCRVSTWPSNHDLGMRAELAMRLAGRLAA